MKDSNFGYIKSEQKFTEGIGFGFMNGEKVKKCPVRCLTTGEEFVSAKAGGVKYGQMDGGRVLQACKGKIKFAGKHPITKEKLYWEFI